MTTSRSFPPSGSRPSASRRDVLKQVACLAGASALTAEAVEAPEAARCDIAELVVIGGGPAGLSAALVAARSCREVLLVDGGIPRNAAAPAVHT